MEYKTNAFIAELIENENLEFRFYEYDLSINAAIYLPHVQDEFVVSRGTQYSRKPVRNNSENWLNYMQTDPLTFSLEWEWVAGLVEYPLTSRDIVRLASRVHSFLLPTGSVHSPKIDKRIPKAPKAVLVGLGKWFTQRCIVTNVELRFRGPWGSYDLSGPDGLNTVMNGDLMPRSVYANTSFEMTQMYNPTLGIAGATTGKIAPIPHSDVVDREYMASKGFGNVRFEDYR